MTKHLRILAPLLAAAALAAGCGDGSSTSTTADSGGYGYDKPASEQTKPAGKTVVEISGSAFQPQTLDVKVATP